LYWVTSVFGTADSQINYVHPRDIYVAPALTWAPNSTTYITFPSSFYHQETKAPPSFLPQRGTVRSNPNGSIPTSFYSGEPTFDKFNRTEYSIGYEFHQQLGDNWKLEQNFRYSYLSIDYRDVTGFDFEPLSDDILSRIYLTAHGCTNDIRLDTHLECRFNTGPLVAAESWANNG
jgi:iron complex outermembrane receptor protein